MEAQSQVGVSAWLLLGKLHRVADKHGMISSRNPSSDGLRLFTSGRRNAISLGHVLDDHHDRSKKPTRTCGTVLDASLA
jgi:hypothetical protein